MIGQPHSRASFSPGTPMQRGRPATHDKICGGSSDNPRKAAPALSVLEAAATAGNRQRSKKGIALLIGGCERVLICCACSPTSQQVLLSRPDNTSACVEISHAVRSITVAELRAAALVLPLIMVIVAAVAALCTGYQYRVPGTVEYFLVRWAWDTIIIGVKPASGLLVRCTVLYDGMMGYLDASSILVYQSTRVDVPPPALPCPVLLVQFIILVVQFSTF